MEQVKFTAMKNGDREDYELLARFETEYAAKTGERLLKALLDLEDGLSGYQVSRLDHSLQTATRAWRDGADNDWVVSALLHDIGDALAPYSHDSCAAAILKPFVREQCTWVVEHHGIFQRLYYAHHLGEDRNARDKYRDHPCFEDCAEFCERWDQASFDPAYPQEGISFFESMVREVFARPAYDPSVIRTGERLPLCNPDLAAERAAA